MVGVGRSAGDCFDHAGIAQLARAPAFQAGGRGFKSRFPLQNRLEVKHGFLALVAQLVEHFLGKEEVTGSIPVEGSMRLFFVLLLRKKE
jgi:hypothetical protein